MIEAKGKDSRGNGTAKAKVTATLTRPATAARRSRCVTDLKITGRPAQFGRGVIQDVGDKILASSPPACPPASVAASSAPAGAPATAAAPGPPRRPRAPDGRRPDPWRRGAGTDGGGGRRAGGGAAGRARRPHPARVPGRRGRAAAALARSAAVPVSPAAPTRRPPADPAAAELDLGRRHGPVLLRRFGPLVAACAVTAVITWVIARRR